MAASVTQLTHTLKKLSVAVAFVDPGDLKAWEEAITPKTRALFGEIIGNPGGSILDLEALAALADSRHIPADRRQHVRHALPVPADRLGRDDRDPFRHEIHRRPRQQHRRRGDRFGQVQLRPFPTIADPSPSYHGLRFFDTFGHYGFLMKLRTETLRDTGACISPMNCFLLIQGLETLSLRMDRHVSNARAWRSSSTSTRRSIA